MRTDASARVILRSTSTVFLVQKDNPKKIYQVGDLLRDEVRLFLSKSGYRIGQSSNI